MGLDDVPNSGNLFSVRSRDGIVTFEAQTVIAFRLTNAEALNLSAWLQCLADPGGEEIARLVKEIKQ